MAEQHGKTLVPEIRFSGFTDPWEQRKFGDGMDLLTGFPFESGKFSDNGINLIRGMNVKRGYLDLSDSLCMKWKSSEGLEKYLLENEDILIQMDGALIGKSYAKIKESQLPALLVQRVTRARAIPEVSNSDFMYQTIQRDFLKYIILNKTDSAVPHLSLKDIREFPIRVPNLEEQKKIGEYLSNLDNLITLHQRKYDKLCVLKKSMLDKMFPKGGSLYPEIRFSGFTDPWEQRKLGGIATFGGGHTPSMSDSDNYEGGNVLWVTSQDVKSHYLDGTTTQITEKGAKELTLYPAGSLVMVTRSGILRHTLPVAELRKPSTVNQDIRVILPQEKYYGQWLLQFFISRNKELLLEFGKTGTTVESVDFSKMRDMVLLTPSLPEQQRIGHYFARLDNLITLHQRKLELLRNIKKSMLDKMFV